MSFAVNLLQTKNRVNDLNKVYTTLKSNIQCTSTGPLSPDKMELYIDYDAFNINCNYCQVPAFNRFYFLTYEINGNLVKCTLDSDPLMSFKTDILNADVIAERSSNLYERYLPDSYVKDLNFSKKAIARFPNFFETGETGAHYVIRIGGR